MKVLEKKARGGAPKRITLIWILLALGFCAIEFPGILFVKDMVYPFVLGMPFLYGYVVCCWVFMCSVLFYAYRTRWGRQSFFRRERPERQGINPCKARGKRL